MSYPEKSMVTADGASKRVKVDCLICAGEETNDHRRVQDLMATLGLNPKFVFVDKRLHLLRRVLNLVNELWKSKSDFVFMEGTGVAGGAAMIIASYLNPSLRYIVSSGDAVETFVRNRHGRFLGIVAGAYERLLYQRCYAFAGWSPYLVGRAFRMGARRGFTLEGAVPKQFELANRSEVDALKRELRIAPNELVIGVSGSINWSSRQKYCYGLDLVNAGALTDRQDIKFLIVGGGSGLAKLKSMVANDSRFVFTGQVPHSRMPTFLGLMDAAVISQTSDELGALRLTTKLPEYLASGVPVALPCIPGAIDYLQTESGSAAWLLPTGHPASQGHASAVADWIDGLSRPDAEARGVVARSIAASRFGIAGIAPRLGAFMEVNSGRTKVFLTR